MPFSLKLRTKSNFSFQLILKTNLSDIIIIIIISLFVIIIIIIAIITTFHESRLTDVQNVNESRRITDQPQETDAFDAGAVTAEEAE